jgi:hypothetical protein
MTIHRLDHPDKILVMDLDGTLIASSRHVTSSQDCIGMIRKPRGWYGVQIRPDSLDFLANIHAYFKAIVVYTSATRIYAETWVESINMRLDQKYHVPQTISKIYCRDDLVSMMDVEFKDLNCVGVGLKNVILLDDNFGITLPEQTYNLVQVPRFQTRHSHNNADYLRLIDGFIKFLATQDDVRREMRQFREEWVRQGFCRPMDFETVWQSRQAKG